MIFVFPPQLGKHRNTKIAHYGCCVNGLPEFSQLMLDFFNNADLQLMCDAA